MTIKMTRRLRAAGATAVLLAATVSAPTAFAQKTWPTKRVTLIVPGAGGSSSDNIARLYADRLSQRLGQPVIIDIRAGGNGAVGARALAAAKPDGYTLMIPGNSIIVLAALRRIGTWRWSTRTTTRCRSAATASLWCARRSPA